MPHRLPAVDRRRRIGLAGGLILFAGILLLPAPAGMTPPAQRMAAVVALMAIWWITEATHIALTALIPIVAFPLLGIMASEDVAPHYANHLIYLYIGGFIVALAMEKWNLHRRVALATIAKVGTEPRRLVLGFMTATAGISLWVSNTATTLMMLPVAMAVVNQTAESARIDGAAGAETPDRVRNSFGIVLLLGVAYAASIGGVGTIVGTPTNVALLGFLEERFPQNPTISFFDWMLVGVPIVIVFLPIAWLYLCRFGGGISLGRIEFAATHTVIQEERRKLGSMTPPEKIVLIAFGCLAFLWVFRSPIQVGAFRIPGWSGVFPWPEFLDDATVSVLIGVILCLLPAKGAGGSGEGAGPRFIMDWRTIETGVPWGVVILFGGGFALAAGLQHSGLAAWIGSLMAGLKGTPLWLIFPLACAFAVVMTEMTSNVATVLMICPVLAEAAIELGINPYLVLIPATIMASFAFMLPVATPPNAIVFSSGWITIPAMFRAGAMLDAIAVLLLPAAVYLLGNMVFRF